jgi:hypothetical protein
MNENTEQRENKERTKKFLDGLVVLSIGYIYIRIVDQRMTRADKVKSVTCITKILQL